MTKRRKLYSFMLAACCTISFGTVAYAGDSGSLQPQDLPAFDISLPEGIVNYADIEGLTGQELADKIWELQGNPDGSMALGDADQDLVYTPVTPCRIVNTKAIDEIITGGTTRDFLVYGAATELDDQGGNAVGCPSPVGEPLAVHVNVTVVPGSSGGNVRVYPAGETTPGASLVNFKPGVNIANAATIKTTSGTAAAPDLEVYASTDAYVIMDVMGYYSMPEKTALESYTVGVQGFVAANDMLALQTPCAAGYAVTGGGWAHLVPYYIDIPVAGPLNEGYGCLFTNISGAAQEVWCYTRCVQTPGR